MSYVIKNLAGGGMKLDIDNREGPLDVRVTIKTTPDTRVSSAAALELFDRFFRDIAALTERAKTIEEALLEQGRRS